MNPIGVLAKYVFPTNNAMLINFLLTSDAEVFVAKHRLSIQIVAKRAKNVYATSIRYIPTELAHTPPLVVGLQFISRLHPPPPLFFCMNLSSPPPPRGLRGPFPS